MRVWLTRSLWDFWRHQRHFQSTWRSQRIEKLRSLKIPTDFYRKMTMKVLQWHFMHTLWGKRWSIDLFQFLSHNWYSISHTCWLVIPLSSQRLSATEGRVPVWSPEFLSLANFRHPLLENCSFDSMPQ